VAATPSCQLTLRVIPRARKTTVEGRREEVVVVRLAAPPVDGAANDELLRALAEWLDLPRRAIALVGGERSRNKRVRIDGLSEADVLTRLGVPAGGVGRCSTS
jgi:uncharacterized protein (TIGR00251 family)